MENPKDNQEAYQSIRQSVLDTVAQMNEKQLAVFSIILQEAESMSRTFGRTQIPQLKLLGLLLNGLRLRIRTSPIFNQEASGPAMQPEIFNEALGLGAASIILMYQVLCGSSVYFTENPEVIEAALGEGKIVHGYGTMARPDMPLGPSGEA